jgi:vacuolar-type H+-ATPase subunit C/Vma6
MPGMGERAYTYAKACGIIGKSFIGKRMRALENAGRLSDLDRMIFTEASRNLPEKELLVDFEDRIIDRSLKSILSIVESFSKPPELLILLVRGYEYADLKSALRSSLEGEKNAPAYTDIGRFKSVRFEAWPDIRAMIQNTCFAFLLDKKGALQQKQGSVSKETVVSVETALDQHYYTALWESISALPPKDSYAAEKILSDEISLRNSGWALRLRTYYRMTADEVKRHLVDIPVREKNARRYKTARRSLAGEAIRSLEFSLDSFATWSSWRWKGFLNPESGDRHWHVDPRYFQNAASLYLCKLAGRYFRSRPLSLDAVFCFIKLKQFEEDILTSFGEGLGMGMSGRDVFSMLGVEP